MATKKASAKKTARKTAKKERREKETIQRDEEGLEMTPPLINETN